VPRYYNGAGDCTFDGKFRECVVVRGGSARRPAGIIERKPILQQKLISSS
jgi:hypothetical protein